MIGEIAGLDYPPQCHILFSGSYCWPHRSHWTVPFLPINLMHLLHELLRCCVIHIHCVEPLVYGGQAE